MWHKLVRHWTRIRGRAPSKVFELEAQAHVTILEHTRSAGALAVGGLVAGTEGRGLAAFPVRNLLKKDRAASQYLPDPEDWNQALKKIAGRGYQAVAFYVATHALPTTPVPMMLATLNANQKLFYLAVDSSEVIPIRAFVLIDDVVREVSVESDLAVSLTVIRQRFIANRYLGTYLWLQQFRQQLVRGNWQGAQRIVEEMQGATPSAGPTAQQAIASAKTALLQRTATDAPDPITFLCDAINEPSPPSRREVILAMGALRQTEALSVALSSADPSVQMMAGAMLRRLGTEEMPLLLRMAEHTHWFVRWQAILCLTSLNNPSKQTLLMAALKDSDPDVCFAAVGKLRRAQAPAAVPVLQTLLPTSVRTSQGVLLDKEIQAVLLEIEARSAL